MASDEDTCAVCHADRPGPKNPIIFCDGRDCNIPIHKRCYGVSAIPKGDWFCQRCECKLNKKPTNVICCPMQTGAFKYTVIPGGFMHVVCAMWNKRIDHTSEIYAVDKKDIGAEECDICHETTGLCIQCQHPDCSSKYHVTCAIESDYLTPASSVTDKFVFYCPTHQPPTRRSSKSGNTKATRRTPLALPRRRKRQDTTSDEEDSISDEDDDEDDDEDGDNGDGEHANSDVDEDEEMGDDNEDDDHEDQGNDGNDNEDDDEDSDDDMGLTTRKRNKSKASSTLSSKRRVTSTTNQRKGPLRLFLDDQNSSDDDMGTTNSNATQKNKLTTQRQQDSTDIDIKKESSPTNSSVLSLPERLKAKRHKMEISSKPGSKQPTSPIIKKSPNLSSPSLALNLNKPSSSTFTPTSNSNNSPSSSLNSKTALSSIKSTNSPNFSGSSTSSTSGLQSDSPNTSAITTSILSSSSTVPTSMPSPSQSTQQYLNGSTKQKLPNKAHLNNNTSITQPPPTSSLPSTTATTTTSTTSTSISSSTSSPKSNFNGNGIINGNGNHRNTNPTATSTPMSSSANTLAQPAKKLPGVNNNSSSSNNNNNGGNRPTNTKVKDLDEIQNDIRAQKRQNSSGGMEMNNGTNNGLYRMMDRKNSQPGFDMSHLNMMKTMIHEAVDTALAGRSAPPPIPVPDLATIQQLQSKLQVAEREIARITNELRRASEFKKNVADIFEGLNIQPQRSIPPGKMEAHIEGLVVDIKNMLLRSGPVNDKERDRMATFAEEIIKDGPF
ncbi:hypothetical protein BC941DRAFT_468172 [Chlamydoabsidia padenii]|nr:hypothetical protein BC941DRAFT_468172 [Chlamydoabsidia padenii]